jgi:hypothetical protein
MGIGTATDLAEKERIAARDKDLADRAAQKEEQRNQEEQKGSVLAGMSDYDKRALERKDGGLQAFTSGELDDIQRRKTEALAGKGDPHAAQWTTADKEAREAAAKAERREKEAERRSDPSYLAEVKNVHIEAREKVFKHMEEGKPAFFQPKKLANWTEKMSEFKDAEKETRQHYQERLKKATPEAIEALRTSVKENLSQAEEAAKKRDSLFPIASKVIEKQGEAFNPEEHIKRLETAWKPSDMKRLFDDSEKRIQHQTDKETKRITQQM